MPDPPAHGSRAARLLRRLRGRVDWMTLFPALAALAWLAGREAVAMLLVTVLPAFLALRGGGTAGGVAQMAPAPSPPPPPDRAPEAAVDDALSTAARAGRDVTVRHLRLSLPGEDGSRPPPPERLSGAAERIAGVLRARDRVLPAEPGALTVLLGPSRRADRAVLSAICERISHELAAPRPGAFVAAYGLCTAAQRPGRDGAALIAAAARAADHAAPGRLRFWTPALDAEPEHDAAAQESLVADICSLRIDIAVTPWRGHAGRALAGFRADPTSRDGRADAVAVAAAARAANSLPQLRLATLCAALDVARDWAAAGLRPPDMTLALDADELGASDLPARLAETMRARDALPGRLRLAIPQDGLLGPHGAAHPESLAALVDAGLALDVDRFCATPVDVAALAALGVKGVILDLRDALDPTPQRRRALTAAVVLARSLRLEVAADGVRSPQLRRTLEEMGLDRIAGPAVAEPMTPGDALAMARPAVARGAG